MTAHPAITAPTAALTPDFIDEIRAGAAKRDAERILPHAIIDRMKRARFGAGYLPTAFGGRGESFVATIPQIIDLASADPNVAHIWRNHFLMLQRLRSYRGGAPHIDFLFGEVAAGKLLSLAGTELTRAQTGGASPFEATFLPQGADFVTNGRKFYSTGVIYADYVQSVATTPEGVNTGFIVPRTRAGVQVLDDWTGMGQRLTGTGTTIFDNVTVRAAEVMDNAVFAPESHALASTVAQLVLTAVIAGILDEIARDSAALIRSRSRTYYFAPHECASQDPILLQQLGEREAEAFAARAVILAAAAAIDRADHALNTGAPEADALAQEAAADAAKAKVITDRLAHAAGTALFDVAGASSTLRERNLDRHWRNLRTVSSHNPASYKAYALGNRTLNGADIPRLGFF